METGKKEEKKDKKEWKENLLWNFDFPVSLCLLYFIGINLYCNIKVTKTSKKPEIVIKVKSDSFIGRGGVTDEIILYRNINPFSTGVLSFSFSLVAEIDDDNYELWYINLSIINRLSDKHHIRKGDVMEICFTDGLKHSMRAIEANNEKIEHGNKSVLIITGYQSVYYYTSRREIEDICNKKIKSISIQASEHVYNCTVSSDFSMKMKQRYIILYNYMHSDRPNS